jgi:tetratricopeptide (TPR) repeat protein
MTHGRLREAVSLLAPLLESLPADPDLRPLVLEANAVRLTLRAEHVEALRYAEEAVSIAEGTHNKWMALEIRGLVFEFSGRPDLALSDHREGTALARNLHAATLTGALVSEAQSLIAAGHLNEAERRLEEAREVGFPADASALRYLETQEADLAMARGRPQDALDPYARSLENAEANAMVLQVLFDLRGMANALGALERDEEAIEVLGLAELQAIDVGGSGSEVGQHLQGDEPVRRALERLGCERAQAARAQGHAVPAGLRVARACQLGRTEPRMHGSAGRCMHRPEHPGIVAP